MIDLQYSPARYSLKGHQGLCPLLRSRHNVAVEVPPHTSAKYNLEADVKEFHSRQDRGSGEPEIEYYSPLLLAWIQSLWIELRTIARLFVIASPRGNRTRPIWDASDVPPIGMQPKFFRSQVVVGVSVSSDDLPLLLTRQHLT